MATEITLRACGGLGPYTWEKTGNVLISSTEGTQIRVSITGVAINNFGSALAIADSNQVNVSIANNHCNNLGFTNLWLGEECDGDPWSSGSFFNPQLSESSGHFENHVHVTYHPCDHGSETSVDLTGNNSYGVSNVDGRDPITLTFRYNWIDRGKDHTAPVYTVPVGGVTGGLLETNIDYRSAAMISGGCQKCDDPSGATVTVTDFAGESISYVVNA